MAADHGETTDPAQLRDDRIVEPPGEEFILLDRAQIPEWKYGDLSLQRDRIIRRRRPPKYVPHHRRGHTQCAEREKGC